MHAQCLRLISPDELAYKSCARGCTCLTYRYGYRSHEIIEIRQHWGGSRGDVWCTGHLEIHGCSANAAIDCRHEAEHMNHVMGQVRQGMQPGHTSPAEIISSCSGSHSGCVKGINAGLLHSILWRLSIIKQWYSIKVCLVQSPEIVVNFAQSEPYGKGNSQYQDTMCGA